MTTDKMVCGSNEIFYRQFGNVFKYVTMKGAKASLSKQTIQFTHPKDLNDPFDCLPSHPDVEESRRELENRFDRALLSAAVARCLNQRPPQHYTAMREQFHLALSSFSGTERSILLWSHYGEGFKGCCFEFNSKLLLEGLGLKEFFSVKYDDTRAPEPIPSSQPKYLNATMEVLLRKASCWQYENERRLFINTQKDRVDYMTNGRWYRRFSSDALVSVTVGMKASNGDVEEIVGLCRDHFPHTIVYRTTPAHNTFSYNREVAFP